MPLTQVSFAVEATPAAVRGARHRISAAVRSWAGQYDDELRFRLELVASELLTNGLVHAGGPLTVEVTLEHDLVVIGVLDGGTALPRPRAAGTDDERGRGLALTEALCLFQGAEHTATGKRCWAVLATASAPGPAAEDTPGSAQDGGAAPDVARWSLTTAGQRLLAHLSPATPGHGEPCP